MPWGNLSSMRCCHFTVRDICIFDVLHKIRSFDLFASHLFLKGSIYCNTWRQYKLNWAARLWPCKCLEVIGLHVFLFIAFDASSVLSLCYLPHVSLMRFLLAHFYLQDMLKAVKVVALEGQGLKYSVKMLITCIKCNAWSAHIYLCPASPETVVALRRES